MVLSVFEPCTSCTCSSVEQRALNLFGCVTYLCLFWSFVSATKQTLKIRTHTTHVSGKFLGNCIYIVFRSKINWLQMREAIREHKMSKIPWKNNSTRGEVYSSSLLLKFLGGQCQISCQQALAYRRPLTDRSTAEQCSVECQTFVSYGEKSLLIFLPLLRSELCGRGGLSATCAYSA